MCLEVWADFCDAAVRMIMFAVYTVVTDLFKCTLVHPITIEYLKSCFLLRSS